MIVFPLETFLYIIVASKMYGCHSVCVCIVCGWGTIDSFLVLIDLVVIVSTSIHAITVIRFSPSRESFTSILDIFSPTEQVMSKIQCMVSLSLYKHSCFPSLLSSKPHPNSSLN